jgi:hypothetical protein
VTERIALYKTLSPSPATSQNPDSSPFETPLSIRKIYRVANHLITEVRQVTDQQNQLAEHLGRFIKGALAQSIELLQTKYNLGRTKLAER